MKKLLSIIVICLLCSNVSIADELSNDFINKNFSKNEIFKKYKERSDIMKNFFSGSVDIKAKDIEYKFYYAGREDTKSGQFYIFYIKNSQPIFLISEETTFAPRSVNVKDLNNDGVNEIILKGETWGTGSKRSLELAYHFEQGEKPNFVKKNYRNFKTYNPPQSYWNDLIPNNFRSNQNYTDFIKILEDYAPKVEGYDDFTSEDKEKKWHLTRLYPDFTVEHEFISGKLVKTKILIELYEPKITLDIYKTKNTISLLNKLFEDIYYVKNACKFDVKFECNFEIPTKYSSGLLY